MLGNKIRFYEMSLACLIGAGLLWGRDDAGRAGDYLRYGAGARALAMGGAFTGVADDVSADHWNPAALAFMDEYQFQSMYAPFELDSDLYYAALGAPLGPRWGTVAFSDIMLRSTGYQGRDSLNLPSGDNGTITDNAFSLSYGRAFYDRWSLGFRSRFFQQNVLGSTGSDWGVDLSAYSKPWNGLSAGLSVNNVNRPAIALGSESDVFVPRYRGGLSYHAPRELVVFAVDADKTEGRKVDFAMGAEYNPLSLLSLRAGWDQNQQVTAGFGVSLRSWKFDYAFANQEDLGSLHRVSLTLRWGNIYRAQIRPEGLAQNSEAIYIEGLRNEIKFRVDVPRLKIVRWVLAVTDQDGRPVRTLSQQYHPGEAVLWDMTDDNGRPVKRGSYRYRFTVEYKTGKTWEERGRFRLDYKTNIVPDVDIRMRTPSGLEGTDEPVSPAPEAVDRGGANHGTP